MGRINQEWISLGRSGRICQENELVGRGRGFKTAEAAVPLFRYNGPVNSTGPFPRNPPGPKSSARLFLALFLLGAAVRAVDVFRPADGRVRESWRECDYAAVARNFHREGMNILRPRIDWRGDGPGFAEMELPVLPWAMAALYKVFGLHEEIGRGLAWLVSLLMLLVFFALARRLLRPPGDAAASLFFVLSPLAVRVSNALQPEGLMLLFLLVGLLHFLRWLDGGVRRSYWLSIAATAAAILVKAPAVHIGILFAGLLLWKKGPRAFLRAETWLFGVLALAPAAAWYAHAHGLYLSFGNSLGLSDETHWIGLDLLRAPRTLFSLLLGAARTEGLFVWTPAGVLFLGALLLSPKREEARGIILWWLGAVGLFYLAALRTVGDAWAAYYHVIAVPPAALTVGAVTARSARHRLSSRRDRFRGIVPAAGLLAVFGAEAVLVVHEFHPRDYVSLYSCSAPFAAVIPEGDLILATGGPARDETGRPVAYNASYFFYWLDRKGWNIPREAISPDEVRAYARKGARFFVCEKDVLDAAPGLEARLRAAFPAAAECPAAILFRIEDSGPAPDRISK